MDDYLGIHERRFEGSYNLDDFMEEFEEEFESLEIEDNPLGEEDEEKGII